MFRFVESCERPRRPNRPRRERPFWRYLLFAGAATGALAATQPWLAVRFTRLFGEHFGPPAWQSSAGFTCLCTCALVFVITLGETKTRSSSQAVRPASMLLVALMSGALLLDAVDGPGMIRGVTARWTNSFYVGAVASLLLLLACGKRLAATSVKRRLNPPLPPTES